MSDAMMLTLGTGLLMLCIAGFYLLTTASRATKTPGQIPTSEPQPQPSPAAAPMPGADDPLKKLMALWNRPAEAQAGPATVMPDQAPAPLPAPPANAVPASTPKAPSYFELAPQSLRSIRSLFSNLNRARSDRHRQEVIAELLQQLRTLGEHTHAPQLLPARQIVVAFEGLLEQLAGRPADISASALRSMAGALLVLDSLSRPGFRPDLATHPPIRLLVVDDDAVNRVAITFALNKLFPPPDLAAAGEPALTMAAADHYDVIFLDVEMPGMDGYELCSKLRASPLNHNTPIIFVTRHSDFESRAKSIQSGAQDLVGKPFLPFEITLKTLTFALRDRLQQQRSPAFASSIQPVTAAPEIANTAKTHLADGVISTTA